MENYSLPKVHKAVNALLTGPAVCSPELRRSIEAYAASLSGGSRDGHTIPEDLISYVTKVTYHADEVTDQDVQRLKEAGYSEDGIFEITLCASVGASSARLECGLRALQGS